MRFCNLLCSFDKLAFFFGLAEFFQNRHQDDAYEDSREATVVQAGAAVEIGNKGHKSVVDYTAHKGILPAVLVSNGAQAVGIAKADADGSCVDLQGEIAAHPLGVILCAEGCHHIAGHNGPYIGGARAGITGAEHTENKTQLHTVEGCADGIVVTTLMNVLNTQELHSVLGAASRKK